jgi:hypothetical protein
MQLRPYIKIHISKPLYLSSCYLFNTEACEYIQNMEHKYTQY